MPDVDNILVNDFMFCTDHGSEWCHKCYCDHRLCNNIRIEDDLENLREGGFDFDEREPLNAYSLGAKLNNQTESYECTKHKKIDCPTCFDWVKLVRAEAEDAYKNEKWLEKRKKWLDRVDPY